MRVHSYILAVGTILVAASSPAWAQYGATNVFQAVSGHTSTWDSKHRMYVATSAGDIDEIVWRSGAYYLATPSGTIRAISSYADPTQYEHVIVSTSVGLEEFKYRPGFGVTTIWRYNPGFDPNYSSMGAFYSPADTYHHVIVAHSADVYEYRWTTGGPVTSRYLTTMPAAIKTVSGYYTSIDGVMHAAVMLNNLNNDVYELWWYTTDGYVYSAFLAHDNNLPGGVSAFGTDGYGSTDYEDLLKNYGPGFASSFVSDWMRNSNLSLNVFNDSANIVAVHGWFIPGIEKAAVMGDTTGGVYFGVGTSSSWTAPTKIAVCQSFCTYVGP